MGGLSSPRTDSGDLDTRSSIKKYMVYERREDLSE